MLAKEKKLKLPRARTRARTRARARPQTPLSLNPNKLLIQGRSRHKFRALVFVIYLFSLFTVSVFFFVKEMYYTFTINENMSLLFHKL